MADWYPGAYKLNQGGNGGSITARPANNIFHIAASSWNINISDPYSGAGIAGWNASAAACNGYVDQYGAMQQYCSAYSSVNGTKQGNWRNRTWESWNPEGLNGTNSQYNSSVWTEEQLWRFADLLAWDHIENGALLQDMQNSLASSWGVGVHRYGVDDAGPKSRVAKGESWTSSAGKPCPGTARVNQVPVIIERAKLRVAVIRSGKDTYLSVGRVDSKRVAAISGGSVILGQTGGWWQSWFKAS